MRAALRDHFGEQPLQLKALRRGALSFEHRVTDHVLNRADQADLCAADLFQYVLEQKGRAGFAVGAGDADNGQLFRRVPKPVCAEDRQRCAGIGHTDKGNLRFRLVLTEYDGCPLLHRGGDILVPVGGKARNGNKQMPRRGFARVIADPGDLHAQVGIDLQIFNILQKLYEFHSSHS